MYIPICLYCYFLQIKKKKRSHCLRSALKCCRKGSLDVLGITEMGGSSVSGMELEGGWEEQIRPLLHHGKYFRV